MSESEMGDQQRKVSDIEYGWIAGFFDGEGTVACNVRMRASKNGGPKVQPQASMAATDMPSLEVVVDVLTRADIAHHVSWQQPKGFTKAGTQYKRAWVVGVYGLRRVERFLRWILPALRTKREKAELALRYIDARLAHSDFRTPITRDEWEMVLQMKALNAKGQPYREEVALNTERPGASSEQLAAAGRKSAQMAGHEGLSERGRKGALVRWGQTTLLSTTAR